MPSKRSRSKSRSPTRRTMGPVESSLNVARHFYNVGVRGQSYDKFLKQHARSIRRGGRRTRKCGCRK